MMRPQGLRRRGAKRSGEIERTLDDVAGVSLEHDVVISCVFVSDDAYQRERSPLLLTVRREGVTL